MILKAFLTTFFLSSALAVPFYSDQKSIQLAPLISSTEAKVIPNRYIVVFKNDLEKEKIQFHHTFVGHCVTEEKKTLAKRSDGFMKKLISGIEHTYDFTNFKGYAGRFTDDVLQKIRESDEVDYVERDQTVHTTELQKNAPWGLSRISHRASLTFGTFNKYPYHETSGNEVAVYIIDTGININHTDFEGRASWGITIPDGDEDIDGNGHGTHVAGTIAGKRYGVAKKAKVIAVKVLRSNGSGTMADVIKGVEWAAEAHQESVAKATQEGKPHRGSSANMSLGGGRSRTLDAAVNGAVDAGLHFAVAAGNDNRDACDYSPAAAEKAITVGASTIEDERAWFSNHGSCVDVFAPGKDITSTWIGSNVGTNTISGTSMASPHVAGLIAYFLSIHPDSQSEFFAGELTPKELKDKISALSTKDTLNKIPANTHNLLGYHLIWEAESCIYCRKRPRDSQRGKFQRKFAGKEIIPVFINCQKLQAARGTLSKSQGSRDSLSARKFYSSNTFLMSQKLAHRTYSSELEIEDSLEPFMETRNHVDTVSVKIARHDIKKIEDQEIIEEIILKDSLKIEHINDASEEISRELVITDTKEKKYFISNSHKDIRDTINLTSKTIQIASREISSTGLNINEIDISSSPHPIFRLNIFDFDGTLFLSPLPNPYLWDSRFIGRLMNKGLIGRGWFQEGRTLEFGKSAEMTGWDGWWNEEVVDQVIESMNDLNALTVLLTGRQYTTFHQKISKMIKTKGLLFDVLGFKPDSNIIEWDKMYQTNSSKLSIKRNQSAELPLGFSTMVYKKAFISGLLEHHPFAKSIKLWEDRKAHVMQFERYILSLRNQGVIQTGTIRHISAPDRYLDQRRERELVENMIAENFVDY
ncbi:hypothetical protein G9A89_010809 [Geosiphon pyriformis]|nr:hypothetical protein G9A89_010809 [Geosiphon pyriformis]